VILFAGLMQGDPPEEDVTDRDRNALADD
jgi:hypothetical protein